MNRFHSQSFFKLKALLLSAGILFSAAAQAQTHLKGQRYVDVTVGLWDKLDQPKAVLDGHLAATISFARYTRNINSWKTTFGYASRQYAVNRLNQEFSVPLQQFTLGYGFEFNWYKSPNRTFFIRSLVQPFVGYESVNRTRKLLDNGVEVDEKSRFMFGADGTLEIEIAPVLIGFRQRWNPGSTVQLFHSNAYIGIRFHP